MRQRCFSQRKIVALVILALCLRQCSFLLWTASSSSSSSSAAAAVSTTDDHPQTTTTTLAVVTPAGNLSGTPASSKSSSFSHHSNNNIRMDVSLGFLGWERTSMNPHPRGICLPPNRNIPHYCCIGAKSMGGTVRWAPKGACRKIPASAHYQTERLALEYLNATSATTTTTMLSSSCDLCQVVDSLLRVPPKIEEEGPMVVAFVGDSMTRQSFAGLHCELLRRGYDVTQTQYQELVPDRNVSRKAHKYDLQSLTTLQVSTVSSGAKDDDSQHNSPVVLFRYYAAFRPGPQALSQSVQDEPKNHVILFDYGLHYNPYKPAERQAFDQDMRAWLKVAFAAAKVVIWRESSAQHFDAPGGYYQRSALGKPCTAPIHETTAGLRRGTSSSNPPPPPVIFEDPYPMKEFQRIVTSWSSMVENNATHSWTWRNVLEDENVHYHYLQQSPPTKQPILWVIPYRNFTKHLTSLLVADECTHFCSNPFVWMPIWRGLRLALDQAAALVLK